MQPTQTLEQHYEQLLQENARLEALVRQVRSALPAILMSGDWDDNLMRRALSEHAYCVLAKPVSRHMVVHVVHKALQKFYSN